jgi:hypothetical protein
MNNQVYITGKGVAPLFTDYRLDFGKRRIGTQNDTTINMVNDGNIASELFFKQFIIKNSDDNNSQTIANIKNIVNSLELLPLKFEYKPTDLSTYTLSASLNCDWNLHPDITLSIVGSGTIPALKTSDYDFGDVVIFSFKDASPVMIESNGNEPLQIDEIKVLGGDAQSFNIDYSAFDSLTLPVGEKLQIPIRFEPQVLGKQKLILGVVNDAMPNYARRIDTLIITGNAVPPATLNADVEFISDGVYSSCNKDTVYAVFKNDNDFPIDLTTIDLQFFPANLDVQSLIDYQSLLPITINAQTEYRLPIQTLLYANESVRIDLRALFNETNERKTSININPKTYSITINNSGEISVSPRDTLSISFNGKIENSSQVPVKFDLTVFLEKNILYMITANPFLTISSGGNSQTIPLKFIQENDKIIFTWDANPVEILKNSSWNLELEFLTLLTPKTQTNIEIQINDNNCFFGSNNQFRTIIKPVCANDYRQIIFIQDEPIVNIYPNPVKNILKIDLDLPKNSYFYISIFDLFGKEYEIDKNLFLSKGKYLLIYVVENMTNGNYYLRTVINDKVEYKNINIIR